MRAVTLRVGSGRSGGSEVVDADQFVVALACIDAASRALAEIGAIALGILVDVAVNRSDCRKSRAFPVDAGVDIADQDAFALGGDAAGGHAAPDRGGADEGGPAVGGQLKLMLALDEHHVRTLHHFGSFRRGEADDHCIQGVLHARHHVERTAQVGPKLIDKGLLLRFEIAHIGKRGCGVHIDLGAGHAIAHDVIRSAQALDFAGIGGQRRFLENDRVVGGSFDRRSQQGVGQSQLRQGRREIDDRVVACRGN